MTKRSPTSDPEGEPTPSKRVLPFLALVMILVVGAVVAAALSRPVSVSLPTTHFPVGTADSSEPSGLAPPGPLAIPGYVRSYVNDFVSTGVPQGWEVYQGTPGGDPEAQFGVQHVAQGGGELLLKTYRDKAYQDRWVTGGLCQCGLSSTYGAYFVRSRFTTTGANEVELLWPKSNQWPPEIDFNETPSAHQTTATFHWNYNNLTQQWIKGGINNFEWHTWGVVWTPKNIEFVLDGRVWGVFSVAKDIPRVPMILVLEQRTSCALHADCPRIPVQMQVDWVAEYHVK